MLHILNRRYLIEPPHDTTHKSKYKHTLESLLLVEEDATNSKNVNMKFEVHVVTP